MKHSDLVIEDNEYDENENEAEYHDEDENAVAGDKNACGFRMKHADLGMKKSDPDMEE